jgi:hypothetical protein
MAQRAAEHLEGDDDDDLPLSFFKLARVEPLRATSSGGYRLNGVAGWATFRGCGYLKRHSASTGPPGGSAARYYRQRDLGSESSGANGMGSCR